MSKKRITSYLVLLVVILTLMNMITACVISEEIPIPTVEENVYIYDEDNIVDDDVEKILNQMLVELEEKTGVEFAVVSVKSMLGRSIGYYANDLLNTRGIGKKEKDTGVLLLFSRSDKKVRLEIGRGLEGCLNDSKCGRLLDDYFVPYRGDDEYTKATEMTVKAVLNVLAKEYEIDIQGLEENMSIENDEEITLSKVLLLIFILFIVMIIIWLLCDNGNSSGRYHRSYIGGSSGGRFGGGFSGGGGASR